MKIFLTGATGYVGSTIAEKLKRRGHKVVGLAKSEEAAAKLAENNIEAVMGNLEDFEILKKAAAASDGVIHTAFRHGSGDYEESAQLDRDVVNAFGEALAGTNKPLIIASTSAILADTRMFEADEDFAFDQNSKRRIRGETERDMEQMSSKGVRAIVLRMPLFIYGRGGSAFITFMIEQAKMANSVNYIGSGDYSVSAIHVEDAANLFIAALEKSTAKGVYNVAAESVSMKELNEAVARLLDVETKSISEEKGREQFGKMSDFFSMNNQLDAAKIKRELDWSPNSFTTILDDVENGSYRKYKEYKGSKNK